MPKFPQQILKKVPYQVNGNADVTAVPVDCTEGGDGITFATFFAIKNADTSDNVLFSFDNVTFTTLKPYEAFSINGCIKTVYIKSNVNTPAYEIVLLAES